MKPKFAVLGHFTIFAALWWAGLACGEDPLSRLEPRIEVSPTNLDFGEACVGIDNEASVIIRNAGEGDLRIIGLETTGAFAAEFDKDVVFAQASEAIRVLFRPNEAEISYEGELRIRSNDPLTPLILVSLQGVGGARNIAVNPSAVDFGIVDEGQSQTRTIEVVNAGGSPLRIIDLVWTSTSIDLRPQGWPSPPFVLPPKASTTLEVIYDPVDLGADRAVLFIDSDDGDQPSLQVPILGRANLAPRAIAWTCPMFLGREDCPVDERVRVATAGLGRILRLDGLSSFDPEGGPLASYEWTMIRRPSDSNASVFFSDRDLARDRATGELQIDEVGSYEVRLTVRDDRGLSSDGDLRASSTVTIRPKDLEVRLVWDIATDVDLHFVRPGGMLRDYGSGREGSTGTDCSPFNRAPDWGQLGQRLDDPRLDRDDVRGRGPEIVSIDFPETDGPYTVFAHYCDSGEIGVPVGIAAEIRVRGRVQRRIPADGYFSLNPGEVWPAAEVQWSNDQAAILPLARPVALRPDLCRSF
ncbi:MAG: choice-of-anchor D domain-containing protein [Myxococcota bacterium]